MRNGPVDSGNVPLPTIHAPSPRAAGPPITYSNVGNSPLKLAAESLSDTAKCGSHDADDFKF
jgi:hypothetical protein